MIKVEWLQSALDELANLWMLADSVEREAITSATHVLDERLRSNPHEEGESRPQGLRITFVPPLAVRFRVERNGQSVTVLHVRLFRRHAN
jgi:hypothetical protein